MSDPNPLDSQDKSADADLVGERTRRGISWNLLGALFTNGMRVVVIAVLGRALDSTDFGIVAAAISVNAILYAIRDVGVGQALIQRKELLPGHQRTGFAVSVYLGLGFSLLLLLGAPAIGDLYGIPESVDVIRVLGVLFTIRGLSATSRMLCQREMRFRTIAIIDAASFLVGSILSMVLAVLGAGPWALVAGYLAEELILSGLYLYINPPLVSLRIEPARLRELMSFGGGQTVAQIAGILATYGDNFVVGNMLGARALGFYTRAYDLIKFPSTVFASIVGSVLFPAFSRLQDDRERLALGFRRALFTNALVLLPASALLFVLAPEVIRVLLGVGWDEAVLPFRLLTVTMLMRTTQKLGGLVASAAGAINGVALAYTGYMVLVIAGAAISIQWGIAGVAVSTGIAITLVSIACIYLTMRVSTLTIGAVLAAHGPGLVLAAVTAAIAWPLATALRGTLGTAGVLAVTMLATVIACLIGVAMLLRAGRGDSAWLKSELLRLRGRRAKR
ncbi:MAG: lipopolysaccharide biosynthesis protein [Kofleriaceae bacterium]